MVQLRLPKGSAVVKGKYYPAPDGAVRVRNFEIYRWSPDDGEPPRVDIYALDLDAFGPMVLDALLYIKAKIDPSVTFRRSCREGICGSCSMNIAGENKLACLTAIESIKGPVKVYPLPHMPVVKDLVANLDGAYAQLQSVEPWLKSEAPAPDGVERRQSEEDRAKLDGLWECILCFCCTTSCPSYWWNGDTYLGPATLLAVNRWVEDTRDDHADERLAALGDDTSLFACRSIMNCTQTCPKGLNPAKAIANLKRLQAARK